MKLNLGEGHSIISLTGYSLTLFCSKLKDCPITLLWYIYTRITLRRQTWSICELGRFWSMETERRVDFAAQKEGEKRQIYFYKNINTALERERERRLQMGEKNLVSVNFQNEKNFPATLTPRLTTALENFSKLIPQGM